MKTFLKRLLAGGLNIVIAFLCMAVLFCVLLFVLASDDRLIDQNYIAFVNENWGIALPSENYVEVYAAYPEEPGIHGDGCRYHIFSYESDISEKFAWRSNDKGQYFAQKFLGKLDELVMAEGMFDDDSCQNGDIYSISYEESGELYLIYTPRGTLNGEEYDNILYVFERYL